MKQGRTAGFTIMEILIVFLLLSIVLMISWPALNAGVDDYRLSAAAEEVVTTLEFAQLIATSGHRTKVIIRVDQDKITVKKFKAGINFLGGESQLAAADVEGGTYEPVENPMNKGTDYQIILPDDSRFSGVKITASDFDADPVTFDSIGTPSKGGTVTLALGNRQRVVTLDAVSGKVSVSE